MKLVFAGGGTAGHVNPALAIAQTVKLKNPDADIMFIGNQNSLEETLVTRAGFPIRFIKIQGLNRKQLHKNIETAKLLRQAIRDCEQILKEFAPDIVVGTGGYVSGPVLLAATKLGIHTCIHEQNAFPGLTSKMLSHRVEKVFISFEDSRKYFKVADKLVLTGNPLRTEFTSLDRDQSRAELGLTPDDFYVLSFGGSLGADVINKVMAHTMAKTVHTNEFYHCHGCGRMGKNSMPPLLKELGVDTTVPGFEVLEYIHDMPRRIAAADVVIARAGAITLGELMAQGKVSVLIPSPNVTHNHQYYNAKALADRGAAIMIEEKDLTADKLYETLFKLKTDQNRCAELSRAAFAAGKPDAAEQIYEHMMALIAK